MKTPPFRPFLSTHLVRRTKSTPPQIARKKPKNRHFDTLSKLRKYRPSAFFPRLTLCGIRKVCLRGSLGKSRKIGILTHSASCGSIALPSFSLDSPCAAYEKYVSADRSKKAEKSTLLSTQQTERTSPFRIFFSIHLVLCVRSAKQNKKSL